MKNISSAIEQYRIIKQQLHQEKVLFHQKPLHVELAEWITAMHFNGNRAESGNQKGWDVITANNEKIQVKSHAKAPSNPSNWTKLSKSGDGVSFIFVIIFDTNLFIEKAYKLETSWAYEQTNKHNEVVWCKMEKAHKAYDLAMLKKQFPFLFK